MLPLKFWSLSNIKENLSYFLMHHIILKRPLWKKEGVKNPIMIHIQATETLLWKIRDEEKRSVSQQGDFWQRVRHKAHLFQHIVRKKRCMEHNRTVSCLRTFLFTIPFTRKSRLFHSGVLNTQIIGKRIVRAGWKGHSSVAEENKLAHNSLMALFLFLKKKKS